MTQKCPAFSVTVKGDLEKVFASAKKDAAKNGIEIKGDTSSGTIQSKKHNVKGKYTVDKQKITLNMEEDIFPGNWCPEIEKEIKKYFA
jgi:hypothetical protein